MLISNLIGGLGNQMFQYACGLACAQDSGQQLKVSLDQFETYTLHQGAELVRVFEAPLQLATQDDLNALLGWQARPLMRRLLGRPGWRALAKSSFVTEPSLTYWDGLAERIRRPCYLHGYWQSERYFAHHADLVRRHFRFRLAMSSTNQGIAERIANGNSISLHVRRGDYASNAKNLRVHGLCSMQYYAAALDHLLARVPSATIYAFSDDPDWVRAEFQSRLPRLEVIAHNKGADSFNDMRLMSLCQHHIIANSSFSWWGAWLNPSPEKIVIAPAQWFANGRDASDLVPKQWLRM